MKRSNLCRLSLGANTSDDAIYTKFLAYCVCHRLSITGDHNDLDAEAVQGVDGFTRFRADLIVKLDTANHSPVLKDMQNDRTFRAPRAGLVDFILLSLLKQPGPSDTDFMPIYSRGNTHGGRRGKISGGLQLEAFVLGGGDDSPGKRVFTVAFSGCSQSEYLISIEIPRRLESGDGGFALGQGASFIE